MREQAIALNVRRHEQNALRGFFDLQLKDGSIIKDCVLYRAGCSSWVAWPELVDFVDQETRQRFQAMALAAAKEVLPEFSS
jgi:hypothetical protein